MDIRYITFIISLIVAAIGIYYSLKSWERLKKIEVNILKAKVFLDKSFIYTNFKFTLVVIGLVTIHMIMESFEFGGILPPELYPVYYAVFPIAILSLLLMIYSWHRLLYKEK